MTHVADDQSFRNRMERVESLLHEVERIRDDEVRALTRQLVQAVLELHGAGLEKMLETIARGGKTGAALVEDLARDDLIGNLLLLHDLHPLDLETRVRQALDNVRPYLRSHGSNVELLAVVEGVVRLRMVGSCDSCPSSAVTLKNAIEEAIFAAAPDALGVEVEGATSGHPPAAASTRFALPLLTH